MTVSEFVNQRLKQRVQTRVGRLRVATLVMFVLVIGSAGIAIAWFAGVGAIDEIFNHLADIQQRPPAWVEAPMFGQRYLFLSIIALLIAVNVVTRISPKPKGWARFVVVGTLIFLMMRYIMWRTLTTLNLSNPPDGTFSLLLFFAEMLLLVNSTIQLFLMLNLTNRSPLASDLEKTVAMGDYRPSVDILIPTYDEPDFILRRTVIGCQAIDYEPKKVYLLDDTRRPHIRALAEQLGCEYLTRPDNRHAKAGNLNHALPQTDGELVAVFDADFIPTKNFLRRTVGFFSKPKIALVQTPQSFYNPDPIAHNLGLADVLTSEEEVFYRQVQPIKDGAGSVVCSGTAFVVRRSALEEAGGFETDSLSEDYFTGIRLAARGNNLIYLDEKLSAGLAAENIAAHISQRIRWARGTLQAFFIEANPLTIPGLTPIQRLAHLEGLMHWFTSFSQIVFLIMPLVYSFLRVIPLVATPAEFLFYFLPLYLIQLTVFSWLNCQSRSALLSDIYSLVSAFPLALTILQVMVSPFSKGFKVTPKGTQSDRARFNWGLAAPLLGLFVATAISLWLNFGRSMLPSDMLPSDMLPSNMSVEVLDIGWFWSAYNLLMLSVALLILLDIPQPDPYQWYKLQRIVRLDIENRSFWGYTTRISELGLEVALTQAINFPSGGDRLVAKTLLSDDKAASESVSLELVEEKIALQGSITQQDLGGDLPRLQVKFEQLSLSQQRRLVELLYCRPGQWLSRRSPGELRSLFLLFRILLRPNILFRRRPEEQAIAVAQL